MKRWTNEAELNVPNIVQPHLEKVVMAWPDVPKRRDQDHEMTAPSNLLALVTAKVLEETVDYTVETQDY